MSLFSKLFGSGEKSEAAEQELEYNGFRILPMPAREGQQWRIGARISKTVDGMEKSHHMIRADMLGAQDVASDASIAKAKQMIDQQGDRLFD